LKTENGRQRSVWITIALCFLMVCVVLGFCSSSKSLYISAITEALDISRGVFSINDSCRYITTSIVNLFFGALIVKFGEKKLIAAGFFCLIVSMLIYSFAENVFLFYLGGVFLGAGLSWTTTTMVGYIVNKWCRESKGTIMGAVLAANGVGAAAAMQIVTQMIYQEGNAFGYRTAYRFVALLLLVTAVIVLAFLKEKKDAQIHSAADKKKSRGNSWGGIPYSETVRKPEFYLAAMCIFLTGMVLQGITGVAAPHFSDVGLSPAFVASVMSIHAIALSCSKFITGFLYDRFALRVTSTICIIAALVSILMLAWVSDSEGGRVLSWIYSVLSSLALPLETVMLPIYAADLFGDASYNKILGIFVSVNTAGYAVGTPAANFCYDLTGDYRIAFYIAGGIMVIVLVVMHLVIQNAERLKRQTLKRSES